MTSRSKTVPAHRSEARLYLAKAEEFLASATTAHEAGRNDAALLAAIHAGISAVDAVCCVLAGKRSTDPDHRRAADLLEQIAGRSPGIAIQAKRLRSLLARKNTVEYESRRSRGRESMQGVKDAERLVSWGREEVAKALPSPR